jgi:hypothetical protein
MTPPEDDDDLDDEVTEKDGTIKDGSPARWAREHSVNRTAQRPSDVSRDQIHRIAVIGFWLNSDVLPGVLDDAYPRIFEDHDGPRIALHAGVAYGPEAWPADANEVRKAAAAHQVTALFEAKQGAEIRAYMAFDPREGMLPIEIYQRFVNSSQANADPDMVTDLVEDCAPGRERTLNLAGLRLGLLVCGENNVLANEQSNGNRALVRHQPDASLFKGVRVVFNGAHSTMGNWGKINERFKYLSSQRRWAFYATNCGKAGWGRSTVRGYYNGVLIADSFGPREAPPRGVPEPRLVHDDVNDRYLALVFDIPGRLLV